MAPTDNRASRPDHGVLDIQKLFYGACGLIVVLAGTTWGLFNTNHNSELEDADRTNGKQWERIRELNDQSIRLHAEMEQTRRYIDDQEARIRVLEHKGERR